MRQCLPILIAVAACTAPIDDDTTPTDVHTDATDAPTDSLADSDTLSDSDSDWFTETDTGGFVGPGATSVLTSSGPQICLHPEDRIESRFSTVSLVIPEPPIDHLAGGGVAIADFNGDGRLDVLGATHHRVAVWTQGANRAFTRTVLHSDESAIDTTGYFGAAAADYDGDGATDALITGHGIRTLLLRNDGLGNVTDVTALAGLSLIPTDWHGAGAAWSDIDGDGDLDLFMAGFGLADETQTVANQGDADPSYLFLNNGDGTFTDVSSRLPAQAHAGWTLNGLFFDADGDGDDDLFLLNDFGVLLEPSHLLWNDGGMFTLDDGSAGLDLALPGHGVSAGDIDNDGDEDLVVASSQGYQWLVNTGGVFAPSTTVSGLEPHVADGIPWGVDVGDVDNDGRLDVAVARGRFDSPRVVNPPDPQRDEVLVQTAPGSFTQAIEDWGLDQARTTRANVFADLDADGWLDLIKPGLDGTGGLFFAACGEQSWMEVGLRQDGDNTFGIGATVRVVAGGITYVRRVRAGGSAWGATAPPQIHVGLGDIRRIDRVEVAWPDGHLDVYGPRLARQRLLVDRRGQP